MNDLLFTGIVSAVVCGAVEGWRRAGLSGALKSVSDESEARTRSLGSNLGPRVEQLAKRLAYVEGKLGLEQTLPDAGKLEAPDGARTGR
jgi:hypothetical protein